VLDSGGNLVMMHRMDGAQFGSLEVAREKAYSAVAFRRPTKVFADLVEKGGGNLRLLRVPGASVLEGGIPIVHAGKIIGAVGVAGVTSQQDAQIAQAGIDAMKELQWWAARFSEPAARGPPAPPPPPPTPTRGKPGPPPPCGEGRSPPPPSPKRRLY